jgi:hypothetical protein
MATRSTIGYETPEGDYIGVYCHWDGYPKHMLPELQSMSWEAVATEVSRALLQGGGRSLQGGELETYNELSDPKRWLRDTWPCVAEEFNYRKRLDGTVECITSRGESIT